jgi:predicted TPR repeat methyltransferase
MNIRQLREGRLVARNYSDVFQDDRAVDKYERVQYAVDSHSTAVNERQRQYLRALVPASFPDACPTQHDFACGTGRGIDMLAGVVAAAHGYDVSPRMIAQAEAARRR